MTYCLAVEQALDDVSLPPAARLTMWHIRKRLTMQAFTEVKAESLAHESPRPVRMQHWKGGGRAGAWIAVKDRHRASQSGVTNDEDGNRQRLDPRVRGRNRVIRITNGPSEPCCSPSRPTAVKVTRGNMSLEVSNARSIRRSARKKTYACKIAERNLKMPQRSKLLPRVHTTMNTTGSHSRHAMWATS